MAHLVRDFNLNFDFELEHRALSVILFGIMLILEQEKGRRLPPNPFTAFGVIVVARLVHFSQALSSRSPW